MADWASRVGTRQPAPQEKPRDWSATVGAPSTFDQAAAARDAATTTTVQTDRLARAQQLRDMGLVDPRAGGNPDVPIEPFMRTTAPPIQPATNANFGASVLGNLVEDEGTKRRLIGQSLFPQDPNAASRVGFLDGKAVYVDETGQLREVSGGMSRFGASLVANAPEMIVGGVGAASTWPIGGGILGAVGARGIKRGLAGLAFGEPQTVEGNLKDLAGEGVVSAAGGAVAKGASRFMDRGRTVDFTPAQVQSAEQARAYIKAQTGIDLDLAQASGDNKLIALRAFAARFPGRSAEMVQAADEVSKGQFEQGVNRIMGLIAKGQPSEVAGMQGINAAQAAITAAKGIRDKAVAPYYEAAGKVVLGADVVTEISRDPLIARAARQVAKDPVFQRKLQGVPENSIAYWQQVKRRLDAGYEKAATAGNRTVAREYADAASQLTKRLEAASPEYAQANQFFADQTRKVVEPLENSAVGVLARIESSKAATAAARMFADPNITATEIRATRASIMAQKDGAEAWNGLVRQWVGQQWDAALRETQTGGPVNAAGKLRQALIGTPNQKAKMDAALGPGAAQAFDDLMLAAQGLARTPTAGSNTMRDTEILNTLKGSAAVMFRWLTSPRQQFRDAAEQRAVSEGVVALTEALQNPAKRNQLRIIVKMPPGRQKAMAVAGILGAQGTQTAVAAPEDRMPSALPQSPPR